MTRNRLLAVACLAALGLTAAPARAGLITFTGSFEGAGLNTDIVPGGTLSGSFSFQINFTGQDGVYNHLLGTLQLTLNQTTIGGVEFSTAAGNVGGIVQYRNNAPALVFVGGTPSGANATSSLDGLSDFWVRFLVTAPGSSTVTGFAADNAAGTVTNATSRTGTVSYAAAVPEPASVTLLGLGAVGVVVRRFRRRAAG